MTLERKSNYFPAQLQILVFVMKMQSVLCDVTTNFVYSTYLDKRRTPQV